MTSSFAKFVACKTSEHIWNLTFKHWIAVFTDYPNIISDDQGPQFTAQNFQVSSSQLGIIFKETPTQSHNPLSLCELHHSIIRRIYKKMKAHFSNQGKYQRLKTFLTDAKCLFDIIRKLSTVSKKRLLIDIAAMQETYTNNDVTNVALIASEYNLAILFTKVNANTCMLQQLMETRKLSHPINQWILPQ